MRLAKHTMSLMVVLVLAAGASAVESSPFTDLARLAPADVALYVEAKDLARLWDDWRASSTFAALEKTDVYQELVASPDWQKSQRDIAEAEATHDLRREDVIEDVFGHPVALAIREVTDETGASRHVALVALAGQNLQAYVDIVNETQQADGSLQTFSETAYKGHTIVTKVLSRPDKTGLPREKTEHYVFAGDVLLVSGDLALLEEAVDRLGDETLASVATDATFCAAARDLPAGAAVLAITRQAPLASYFLSHHPAARNMQNPFVGAVLSALRAYVSSVSTTTLGVYADLSVRLVSKVTYSPEALTPEMRRFLNPPRVSTGALELLPARTLACLQANVAPGALVDVLRQAAPGEHLDAMDNILALTDAFTGSPSGRQAAPAAPQVLGTEFALACVRSLDREGPPNAVLILGLNEQQNARATLAGALGATTALVALDHREKGKPFNIDVQVAGGTVVYSFGPVQGFTPAYAFIGPYLVVSTDVVIVREIASKQSSLAETAGFATLLGSGKRPADVLFVDIARAADLLDDYRERLVTDEVKKGKKPEETIRKELGFLGQLGRLLGAVRITTYAADNTLTSVLEITPAPPAE